MKIRRVINDFSQHMEKRLRDNDRKPGWSKDTKEQLLEKLKDKVTELYIVLSKDEFSLFGKPVEEITKEAADIANYAMMIHDNWGTKELPPKDEEEDA